MTRNASRVPLIVSLVAALSCAGVLAAARTNDRDRDKPQPEHGQVAPAPENERDFAETERGCLDGRIKDYYRRHSDNGVIDPFVMLELSRDMQRTMELEQRRNLPFTFRLAALVGTR
jgi:hypothetical protein